MDSKSPINLARKDALSRLPANLSRSIFEFLNNAELLLLRRSCPKNGTLREYLQLDKTWSASRLANNDSLEIWHRERLTLPEQIFEQFFQVLPRVSIRGFAATMRVGERLATFGQRASSLR